MASAREDLLAQIQHWQDRKRVAEEDVSHASIILETLQEALARLKPKRTTKSDALHDATIPRQRRGPKGTAGPIKAILAEGGMLTVQQIEKLLREQHGLDITRVAIRNMLRVLAERGEVREERAPKDSGAKLAYRLVATKEK